MGKDRRECGPSPVGPSASEAWVERGSGGTGSQAALQVEPEGCVMSEERSFRNPPRGMDFCRGCAG